MVDEEGLLGLVREAGLAILRVYEGGEFGEEKKADLSPLTAADRAAHEVLMAGLARLAPGVPVVSEEGEAAALEERLSWGRLWMVDPLDGTKEFLKKNGEFTVNVALVEDGLPVWGIVHQPVTGVSWYGGRAVGAWRLADGELVRLRGGESYEGLERVRVVGSRSHLSAEVEEFVDALRTAGKEVEFRAAGSSLKICLVAEGEADVYPRFAPTMEWDTAAAQAVAEGAGREVVAWEGGRACGALRYNKEDLLNPWFLVR